MKKFLFVMDPLNKLDPYWDSSLRLLREFNRRGHRTWACDITDVGFEKKSVRVRAGEVRSLANFKYRQFTFKGYAIDYFDLVVIRKEPPFDMNYIYATYLLELTASRVPMANHPAGIRNANEKLSILKWPREVAETLVAGNQASILAFRHRVSGDLVLKPLDQKGGTGVCLLRVKEPHFKTKVARALARYGFVMVQKFLRNKHQSDKRILVLNGKILGAYEKRPKRGDFRGNLSIGATCHRTTLTSKEKQLVANLKSYFKREGLIFVGLDVMNGKMIEINVTCPAGIPELEDLYPKLAPVKVWARCLENLLRP